MHSLIRMHCIVFVLIFLNIAYGLASDELIMASLEKIDCDFQTFKTWPAVYPDAPFVIRRTNLNQKFRKHITLKNILDKYGERIVGVDYPGTRSPPTKRWQSMKLKDFIRKYVDHGFGPTEITSAPEKNVYLWGLTDNCDTFGMKNCKANNFTMFPQEIEDEFHCFEPNVSKYIGLNGAYKGFHYHSHGHVSNEVVFGSRMWVIQEPNYKIFRDGKTASSAFYSILAGDNSEETPYFCKLGPGDIIYIPDGWVHMTYNLEPTLTIACNLD